MKKIGMLVGAGSVGKKHALNMDSIFEKLIIVDQDPNALKWCAENLNKDITTYQNLENALKKIDNADEYVCIIANWGVDHDSVFFKSYEKGISKFYIEKPFANSLFKIDQIKKIVKEKKLSVVSGFHHRHSNLLGQINDVAKKYLGGLPELISVSGGANCIVTNGIHFLDLACSIFKSNPISVSADLNKEYINPRSKYLGFWEGVSSWNFPKRRKINICFTNKSSVRLTCNLICPKGIINISIDGDMNIYIRDDEEMKNDPRIIRTGDVYKSEIVKNWQPTQFIENTKNLVFSLSSDNNNFDIDRETIATEWIIGALISNEMKSQQFNLLSNDKTFYEKEWPIS